MTAAMCDILFRMLRPRELAAAMGFPPEFALPPVHREAVRLIGNAVAVPMAQALILASFPGMRPPLNHLKGCARMKRQTIEHYKTHDLMRILGIPRYAAVGILESLWHATAKYTPQGDIGRKSDVEIAFYVGWEEGGGEPARLISALLEAGWLDASARRRLLVHDYHDHADDSVKKTLRNRGLPFLTTPEAKAADEAEIASAAEGACGGPREDQSGGTVANQPECSLLRRKTPEPSGNNGNIPECSVTFRNVLEKSALPEPEPEPSPASALAGAIALPEPGPAHPPQPAARDVLPGPRSWRNPDPHPAEAASGPTTPTPQPGQAKPSRAKREKSGGNGTDETDGRKPGPSEGQPAGESPPIAASPPPTAQSPSPLAAAGSPGIPVGMSERPRMARVQQALRDLHNERLSPNNEAAAKRMLGSLDDPLAFLTQVFERCERQLIIGEQRRGYVYNALLSESTRQAEERGETAAAHAKAKAASPSQPIAAVAVGGAM